MIPTKYLAKLDPTYQQALVELQNALFKEDASFEFTESCEKLVNEFPLNYLTPNILWEKIWKFYAYNNSVNILQTLLFHFTYPVKDIIRFSYMQNVPKRKLMDKEEAPNHGASSSLNLVVNIEDLRYPHNLLEYYLYCYELNANSHLSNKIIKRNFEMRNLYERIKKVESNDEEKWIYTMAEADDSEFVKHNIEYKLGKDLTNKKLWILYIKYLKENDIQDLLITYSKYCRFFVDDIAMKEEYRNAAEIYGEITVPWKNVFDFERYNKNFFNIEYPKRPNILDNDGIFSPQHFFDLKTTMPQKFPFWPNLMNYILKNAKANILQKLYFSCKYFYSKYRKPVCYCVNVLAAGCKWPPHQFKEETYFLHSNISEKINLDNLYISTKFSYNHLQPLNTLIPKIYQCDAKFIKIVEQNLTIKELKFFIGHGNVIDLDFCRVKITDFDENLLNLDDILAFTPMLQYLQIFPSRCSSETAQKLCELPFTNKFMSIVLRSGTNNLLEPNALGKFIYKSASSDCKIIINFDAENREFTENFERTVKSVIDFNWKYGPKPNIKTFNW